ncbi:MAG: cytochrome c3 family protein [Thermoanaerobaculia bacterium]|nr:cytochrome c3 family protein [Thermoanaerobaculia bacterium]
MTRALALIPGLLLAAAAAAQGPPPTSCVSCHSDPDLFEEEALEIVASHAGSLHAARGIGCHDCHGGNPDPALAEELDAMDEGYEPNPYRGVVAAADVPGLCGECHSDPTYMRRFDPDARVDQVAEYWTSQHGLALAAGDVNVATCVGCHGAHGIVSGRSKESPVHPSRVAQTCAACHSDAERMGGYTLDDGTPLPVNQHALWRVSVHARALLDRGDLFAPTCNDCHGNHGAAPPGVDSINFVCGQCHGREADLFRGSAKREAMELHREYLADAGEEGCAACHEAPEPAAELSLAAHPFTECASCHRNHAIVRPTLAALDPLPATPCAFCHEGVGPLAPGEEESAKRVRHYEEELAGLLGQAEAAGLSGAERFDWLVERALSLPAHNSAASERGERRLRAEFGNLFQKFRIGKTRFTYDEPASGETVELPVIRCGDCHAAEPLLADEPAGLEVSAAYVKRIQELTSTTARAERALLAARRGGVDTREAQAALELAVDAQIQLEVLLHAFERGAGSFSEKHAEGMDHARGALGHAREALAELRYRRTGLGVSLVVIVLVLVALALKIREVSRREALREAAAGVVPRREGGR